MDRELTAHKMNELNELLRITVRDKPGAGGAHHRYQIHDRAEVDCWLYFQSGPIAESGVNGISNEALLAVVIDRLQCFQKGDYACRENALALTKLEEAMHWLQYRTRERLARGVEGTHQK